ncbi:hypothetical protein KTJ54_12065 [Acinetobacter radioresistens]|uniref:hypothetical protein n=1 Tax=Acinetobacter radioresistens TaxID=40216 RepID=UPI0021CE39B2|nr:hypothetical protein [Acinetobacter radioresistens]MCU4622838.1 hypothetical protein [Acinetobacter radioresistens]
MINARAKVVHYSLLSSRSRLLGTVKIKGIPEQRMVRVYSGIGGELLAQALSDKNGRYMIIVPYAPNYTIISIDHKKIYNAVIQDNVVPK